MLNYRVASQTVGHESRFTHLTIFITRVAIGRLFYYLIFLVLFHGSTALVDLVDLVLLIFEVSRSHSDRHITLSRTPLDD